MVVCEKEELFFFYSNVIKEDRYKKGRETRQRWRGLYHRRTRRWRLGRGEETLGNVRFQFRNTNARAKLSHPVTQLPHSGDPTPSRINLSFPFLFRLLLLLLFFHRQITISSERLDVCVDIYLACQPLLEHVKTARLIFQASALRSNHAGWPPIDLLLLFKEKREKKC